MHFSVYVRCNGRGSLEIKGGSYRLNRIRITPMLKDKNLEISRHANQLAIIYRWRQPMAYALLFFSIIWNGAVLLFLFSGAGWFVIGHLLAGIGIGYYGLAVLLNRTQIQLNRQHLTVRHGPLPTFRRNREFRSSEVSQLHLKRSGSMKSGNRTTLLYALRLRTTAGRDYLLVGGISDKLLGERIENEIEEYLAIEDQPTEAGFVLPDLGMLEKFISPEMRREMENAGREAHEKTLTPSGSSLREVAEEKAETVHADHLAYDFALCHAEVGSRFTIKDRPYRLAGSRSIRWTDQRDPAQSRIIQAAPEAGDRPRQVYAVADGNQWAYYEERPLDPEECELLGFTGLDAPLSLRNGEDRYHLLSHRKGNISGGGKETAVDQYLYYTSRSSARFRALKSSVGRWQVAIQEPLDSTFIEALA